MDWTAAWADASRTGLGFFWKSGWAFVLGYFVSAMIQVFVPKERLTRYLGDGKPGSIALATGFGAASSSCSFAALATARALLLKGAHWIEAVAFMFASTNLVIELGMLIVIFLGWEYLAAEVIGGLILIAISSTLIKLTYPQDMLDAARDKVEEEAGDIVEDFDPWERIKSGEGWRRVGDSFVGEWAMVWEEILIGFSIAGMMAAWVPTSFWEALFLLGEGASHLPTWLVALENAVVGPLVAMMTFIGSMGNIPLATVLAGNGVLFAGIMAFIYSDLVVPPLVLVNRRYYGWRVALYIAGIMFVSIVTTALLLGAGFSLLGIVPETSKVVDEVTRFEIDYTFWLNLGFVTVAGWLVWLWWRRRQEVDREGGFDWSAKRIIALAFAAFDLVGIGLWLLA